MKQEAKVAKATRTRYHELKTIQPYFELVQLGIKAFEIRKNDRDYKVDDYLLLKEYDPDAGYVDSKPVIARIKYILNNEEYVAKDHICMSIEVI